MLIKFIYKPFLKNEIQSFKNTLLGYSTCIQTTFYSSSMVGLINFLSQKERFYTRGTIRGISISSLSEIPTLYLNWLSSLNQENG